jgi:hypothetical protein
MRKNFPSETYDPTVLFYKRISILSFLNTSMMYLVLSLQEIIC